jgi:hypothetical protein
LNRFIVGALTFWVAIVRLDAQPQISEDRELKEFDLTNH